MEDHMPASIEFLSGWLKTQIAFVTRSISHLTRLGFVLIKGSYTRVALTAKRLKKIVFMRFVVKNSI